MPKGNQVASRSKATVNRLKMYNSGRAKRDKDGKFVSQEFKSRDVSHQARIQPDRRWFDNTRTVNQTELERFREEFGKKLNNPTTYVLKPGKVPYSLLKDVKPVREFFSILRSGRRSADELCCFSISHGCYLYGHERCHHRRPHRDAQESIQFHSSPR